MSPPKGSTLFFRPACLGGRSSTSSSEVSSLCDDESSVGRLPLLLRLLSDLFKLFDLWDKFSSVVTNVKECEFKVRISL